MCSKESNKSYDFFPKSSSKSSQKRLLASSTCDDFSLQVELSESYPLSPDPPDSASTETSMTPFSPFEPPLGAIPLIDSEEPIPSDTGSGIGNLLLTPTLVSPSFQEELRNVDERGTAVHANDLEVGYSPSSSVIPELYLKDPRVNDNKKDKNGGQNANKGVSPTQRANGSVSGVRCEERKPKSKVMKRICYPSFLFILGIVSLVFFLLYMKALITSQLDKKRVCLTPDCLRVASRILDRMDRSVSPCDNFYQFSCGNYIKANIVPEGAPHRSSMQEIQEDVLVIIKKMLTEENSVKESEAMGKAKRLYNSCVNTSFTVHEKDKEDSPIYDIFTEGNVGGWPIISPVEQWNESTYDLPQTLSFLTMHQVTTLFDSYITPDEKNLSFYSLQFYKGSPALPRSYYLNSSNENYADYIAAYKTLITEVILDFTGETNFNSSHVDEIIDFETQLAEISGSSICDSSNNTNSTDDENDQPDSNPKVQREMVGRMTVKQLNKLFPQIGWLRFLKLTFDQFEDVNVKVESLVVTVHCATYIPEVIKLLENTPKRIIVNYLLWRFMFKYLPFVSNYFQQLWRQFRTEVPNPFEERIYVNRWKECAAVVNEGFGAVLANKYIKEYFDVQIHDEVDKLVEEVRSAFNSVIHRQEWLDDDMKKICSDKLYLMGKKIGYPEYIESNKSALEAEFNGLDIHEDHFLNNIMRMKKFEVWKELKKLSRYVDKKKDWLIQPLIVNAFHNPTANEIILPLGIIREPFYNFKYPMYVNYGSLGMVIGHELVHGFDNHGKKYDKHGNISQWWTGQMADVFTERASCFIDQYSQFPIEMVDKMVDGNETLGDNICDNTGLLNAWEGYKKWMEGNKEEPLLPGLNYTIPQMFLISFGQIWCEVVSKAGYEKYSKDMHSPGIHRTNGVAQNSEFFSKVWECPLGSPMNPEKKCKLWE